MPSFTLGLGLGTRDDDLQRLIVTRAEIDLPEIKREYQNKYQKSLAVRVEGETSGTYRKCLLKVIECCDDYVNTVRDVQRPASLSGTDGLHGSTANLAHAGSVSNLHQKTVSSGSAGAGPPPPPTSSPPKKA